MQTSSSKFIPPLPPICGRNTSRATASHPRTRRRCYPGRSPATTAPRRHRRRPKHHPEAHRALEVATAEAVAETSKTERWIDDSRETRRRGDEQAERHRTPCSVMAKISVCCGRWHFETPSYQLRAVSALLACSVTITRAPLPPPQSGSMYVDTGGSV